MSAAGSIVGFVRVCTQQDAVTQACVAEAWMPPPTFLPVLTWEESAYLFSHSVAVLVYAWGWKVLARQIRW